MQLGKALLGAIIGAAVGIALLLVVYLTTGIDKVWLSIPFAFITGFGVRMFARTTGHPSYLRGALTMLIALAAYIGGWIVVAQVATAKANAPSAKPPVVGEGKAATEPGDAVGKDADAKDAEGKDVEGTDESKAADAADEEKDAEAVPKAAPPKVVPRTTDSTMPRGTTPRAVAYTPWDIICLSVAALVAYEMGRGSGVSVIAGPPVQSTPTSTHPDA